MTTAAAPFPVVPARTPSQAEFPVTETAGDDALDVPESDFSPTPGPQARMRRSLAAVEAARGITLQNIANANTPGYKRSQVIFRKSGKIDVRPVQAPGRLEQTDRPLDVAIDGKGFFPVRYQNVVHFTRSGTLTVDAGGRLVVAHSERTMQLMPAMRVPPNATGISLEADGRVVVSVPGTTTTQPRRAQLGQISLARFQDATALRPVGNRLLAVTEQSGDPIYGIPGKAGFGALRQGHVELSNVHLPSELELYRSLERQSAKLRRRLQEPARRLARKANAPAIDPADPYALEMRAAITETVDRLPIDIKQTTSGLLTARDVLLNNLANVGTTAFKRSWVMFEDVPPDTETHTSGPVTKTVGRGSRAAGTLVDFSQGEIVPTSQPLNVAIDGPGFFHVRHDGESFFTRVGRLSLTADRQLAIRLGSVPCALQPPIAVPENTTALAISADGLLEATLAGTTERRIGRIELCRFVNPQGLRPAGAGRYRETPASGSALAATPGTQGAGTLRQGALESSNVDIDAERAALGALKQQYEALRTVAAMGAADRPSPLPAVTDRTATDRPVVAPQPATPHPTASQETSNSAGRETDDQTAPRDRPAEQRDQGRSDDTPRPPLPAPAPDTSSSNAMPRSSAFGHAPSRLPAKQIPNTPPAANSPDDTAAEPHKPWYERWLRLPPRETAPETQPEEDDRRPPRGGFGIGYPGR